MAAKILPGEREHIDYVPIKVVAECFEQHLSTIHRETEFVIRVYRALPELLLYYSLPEMTLS
jgi:hypothetical protein